MLDRRSRAQVLGLELMEQPRARLPGADDRTRALGDILADLGYTQLQDAVAEPLNLKKVEPENLLQALRMVNITPFTWDSVNRYKFETINKLHNPAWLQTAARMKRTAELLLWSSVPVLVGTGWLYSGHASVLAYLPVGLIGIGLGLASMFIDERRMELFAKRGAERWKNYEWVTASLKDYTKEIPLEAAERIAAVRAIYPKAKFEIEFLTETPDPFLVVRHRDERYAIAVWDEPSFDGELIA